MEEYQILSDRFPGDIEGQYHLADLALDMGRLEDAEQALQKCITAEPDNPYCNMDLMVLKLLRNDFDGVLARYKKLHAEKIQYSWFHVVTGAALLGKDDLNGATEEFDALEAAQGKLHGRVHFRTGKEWLAEVQLYRGKAQSAVEQMKTALKTAESPEERASYLLYIAKVESLVGNDNSAKSAAAESIHISNSALTYISAAAALAAIGDRSAMDQVLSGRLPGGQEIGEVGPANLDFMKGAFSLKHGRTTDAIRELASSHELDNNDLYTIFLLGQAHEHAGHWALGSELFKRIIDAKGAVLWNEPSSLWALAHYELANCYFGLGEAENAKTRYSEFLSLWSMRTLTSHKSTLRGKRSHV